MPKYIFRSFSGCVKAICEGEVKQEDVVKVIAGTKAFANAHWQEIFDTYSQSSWHRFPEKAVAIAKSLIASGIVDQPRLRGEEVSPYPLMEEVADEN